MGLKPFKRVFTTAERKYRLNGLTIGTFVTISVFAPCCCYYFIIFTQRDICSTVSNTATITCRPSSMVAVSGLSIHSVKCELEEITGVGQNKVTSALLLLDRSHFTRARKPSVISRTCACFFLSRVSTI